MTRAYDEAVDMDVDVDPAQMPDRDAGGLRGDIYSQLMQLGPADHEALAQLLQLYPDQQQQILQIAAQRMGNAAVQRALAIVNGAAVGAPPSAENQAEVMQMFRDENGGPANESPAVGTAPSQGDADSQRRAAEAMQDFREVNNEPGRGAPPSAANAAAAMEDFREVNAEPVAVSAWDSAARYNAAHQHLVDEFNSLTDGTCVGKDGAVDPELVAKWQSSHDLVADGMVGPMTVAAAHHAAEAKQAEVPQAPNIEEIEEELE